MSKRKIRGFSNIIVPEGSPAPDCMGDVCVTFEYPGWSGTVANPITSYNFAVYSNSATASYEFSGWPGTVANPITSSDFSTYNNSATSSFEPPGWT
jgi:hypothetical protein